MSDKSEVSITVPSEFFGLTARLATLLNRAVEEDTDYEEGIRCLEDIHQQVTSLAETAARMIRAVLAERDLAVQDRLDAELLKEAADIELEELETAIEEYRWTDHPVVRDLVQRIQDDVEAVMEDEYYDRYIETMADDMAVHVARLTGLGHMECITFVRAIIDGDVTTPEARYWDRETFASVLMALAEKYKEIE